MYPEGSATKSESRTPFSESFLNLSESLRIFESFSKKSPVFSGYESRDVTLLRKLVITCILTSANFQYVPRALSRS